MGATLVSGMVTLWWIVSFRRDFIFDIDESAYSGAAWDDAFALTHHGVSGLWHASLRHSDFGPLVPLTALPFELVTVRSLLPNLAVELIYLALLLVSTAAITRRAGQPPGRRAGGHGRGLPTRCARLAAHVPFRPGPPPRC